MSQLQSAVDYIRSRSSLDPEVAIILGSGLGELANLIDGVIVPYTNIPGVLAPTAPTHAGYLHIGQLFGVTVVAMQGRMHMYEGYSPQEVVFPVQVMAALGAKTLLVTNAAGGLHPDYNQGDLVLIEDHLSLANLSGGDPLRGPNDDQQGPRFTSLNNVYTTALLDVANRTANEIGLTLRRGVYGFVVGPSLETPAEVRALRRLGCDLVGMSTVPEVIAATHMGLDVLAISAVANTAISSLDDINVTSAEAVFTAMETIRPKLQTFLENLVPNLSSEQPS